ncbi:hypothetical protein RFI_09214, partial [Reticulomyxa filosa]
MAQRLPQQDMTRQSRVEQPLQPKEQPKKQTTGSGFYGETNLKGNADNQPLPDDAIQTVNKLFAYVDEVERVVSNTFNTSEKASLDNIRLKFEQLHSMISNNEVSISAYSRLEEVTESLRSGQYTQAHNILHKLNTDRQTFNVHKAWITALRSLYNMGKNMRLNLPGKFYVRFNLIFNSAIS